MLVRIPNASHGIAKRPSNLITKVNAIIAWFEKYRTKKVNDEEYRKIHQTGKLKLEIDKLKVLTMIKIFQQQKFSFIE